MRQLLWKAQESTLSLCMHILHLCHSLPFHFSLSVQLLWKYSKAAVALRLQFLQQAEGVQARTALVQDIPGVHFGTLMHRADTTVLRVLPGIIKEPLKKTVSRVVDVGNKGLKATTGRINNALVSRCEPSWHSAHTCTLARLLRVFKEKPASDDQEAIGISSVPLAAEIRNNCCFLTTPEGSLLAPAFHLSQRSGPFFILWLS